jgi:4-amino-4-deoxy-L-arabinose transferase-like glycosyltransferase
MSSSTEHAPDDRKNGAIKKSRLLTGILISALLLRLATILFAYSFNPDQIYSNDSPSYLAPALSLLEEGGFHEKTGTDTPMYVRTPGYPLFITIAFLLFDRSVWGILLLQAFIGVATILVTYWLCRYLWNEKVALIASVLMAIGPLQVVSCAKILTECLHGFVLIIFALVSVRLLSRTNSPLYLWFLAGLMLALSTLVRPITYYFLLLFLPFLAWRFRGSGLSLRPLVARFLILLLPIVVLIGGWSYRNWMEVGSWRFSGIEGVNMYFYRGAGVIAELTDRSPEDVRKQLRAEAGEPLNESQGSFYDRLYGKGVSLIKDHPKEVFVITVKGLISEALGVRSPVFYFFQIPQKTPWLQLAQTLLILIYASALVGIVRAFRNSRERVGHLFCLTIVLYVIFLSAGPEANPRFRTPVMSLIGMYAAAGIAFIGTRARRKRDDSPSMVA